MSRFCLNSQTAANGSCGPVNPSTTKASPGDRRIDEVLAHLTVLAHCIIYLKGTEFLIG